MSYQKLECVSRITHLLVLVYLWGLCSPIHSIKLITSGSLWRSPLSIQIYSIFQILRASRVSRIAGNYLPLLMDQFYCIELYNMTYQYDISSTLLEYLSFYSSITVKILYILHLQDLQQWFQCTHVTVDKFLLFITFITELAICFRFCIHHLRCDVLGNRRAVCFVSLGHRCGSPIMCMSR